ncbi:hypothetical protein SDC9_74375 [bioreactor metagenome]|uniref:Uncharacterized protein n=1 Tax=bioreactor metagenome TaxID=1076179 RepID=A0A644YHC7_9ZZZZ
MRIGGGFGKLASVLACGVFAMSAMAGFWDWTRPFQGPERYVTTLVITGNYKRPLALAQLIRVESRQPYLLVPAVESGNKEVFFCPAIERTPAMKLRDADISRFVRLLNPDRVIVLGDERYVASQYMPVLDGRIPVIRIDSDNWENNAATLGTMLNLNNLRADYTEISRQLEPNVLYKPLPAKPAAAPAEAETVESVPAPKAAPDAPAVPEVPAVPATPDPAAGEVTPAADAPK